MTQRNLRSEQILTQVLSLLKNGGYAQGDQIPTEKELCHRLGVGRNSIREVMKMLNMAGMTQSIPGKGTFLLVVPSKLTGESGALLDVLHGTSLQELLEVRRMIETEAAAMAAVRWQENPEGFADLKQALEILEQALDRGKKDIAAEGFDFHMALVRLGGNRLLQQLLHPIVEDLFVSRKLIPVDLTHVQEEKALHRAIVDAVESGDPEKAKNAVLAHFDNTAAYY